MELAHATAFAGHLGVKKTKQRFLQQVNWPGFIKSVKSYCKSCDVCQKTTPKGRVPQAFIQDTDTPSRPFQKLAMDIVGPLKITSNKGNRYILTVVDLCTRWPEATLLKYISSEAITDSLLLIFSRIGFP